jgi:DNA-binding response OmpR family regulator
MKKILIVNNDPDTMQLLQDLLQTKGFRVRYSARREEVPAIINSFKPNLVLLDITQRVILDEISIEAAKNNIPVLLMTGHNSYPEKKENEFKYFIKKPFTLNELVEKINLVYNTEIVD